MKDSRREVKKLRGVAKIRHLLSIEENIPEELTNGARSFYFTQLVPVLGCSKHHFRGDRQMGLEKRHQLLQEEMLHGK